MLSEGLHGGDRTAPEGGPRNTPFFFVQEVTTTTPNATAVEVPSRPRAAVLISPLAGAVCAVSAAFSVHPSPEITGEAQKASRAAAPVLGRPAPFILGRRVAEKTTDGHGPLTRLACLEIFFVVTTSMDLGCRKNPTKRQNRGTGRHGRLHGA